MKTNLSKVFRSGYFIPLVIMVILLISCAAPAVSPTATNATTPASTVPKYNISINAENYSFNFKNLTASQSGMYNSNEQKYDLINGLQTSSTQTPAAVTTSLNWAINGFVWDTVYSFIDDDGVTYRKTDYSQECIWEDTTSFSLFLKINQIL